MLSTCVCGTLHHKGEMLPVDEEGCILPAGHDGPHEFVDSSGQHWLWETDFDCDCEHCMSCEGDYCTTYWPKPATDAQANA